MAQQGRIVKVAGPLIVAENMADVRMYDVVRVSKNRLVGEVIELRGDKASIQVYEETSGLGPGEPVESTGAPLSVELGPGLIESIFDGIQRPLTVIAEKYGMHITRGVEVPSLNRDKEWGFEALVKPGDKVTGGTIIGQVQESAVVEHRIMVPHGISGEIVKCESKVARLTDVVAVVRDEKGVEHELTMLQKWPVRRGRPYAEKLAPKAPMVTGQRVIDTFSRLPPAAWRLFPARSVRANRRAASAGKVGGCGYHRLRRLRRARQRDDRRSARVPGTA